MSNVTELKYQSGGIKSTSGLHIGYRISLPSSSTPPSDASAYTVNANTRLYYKFNGTATDSSGLGNNGTDSNVTYPNGRFAQAVSYAGNTGSFTTSPVHHPINAGATFSFWVNMNTSQAGALGEWSPTPSQCNYLFRFNINDVAPNYGVWFSTSDTTGGTQDILVSGTNVFTTGTWVHVGGTIASNGNKRLYINGAFVSSSNQGGTINNNNIQTFIGKIDNGGFQTPLLGLVDEFIIEQGTPWTDAQFLAYYNASILIPPPISGLQAKYLLATNSNDTSGNGYNGTDNNITYSSSAAVFNGTNGSIRLPNISVLKPSSSAPKTIYTWFKNSVTYAPYGMLWSGGYEVANTGNSSGFIALTNNNIIRLTGIGTDILDASFTHNDGLWHSLVCVVRSTSAKIYIDGTLRSSGNITLNAGVSTFEPTLGALLYGLSTPSNFFSGSQNEVFIVDGESTAGEISDYYLSSVGRH